MKKGMKQDELALPCFIPSDQQTLSAYALMAEALA